ncbi:Arrowhead [Operophtera brumata]|uniref:Arrowhead n=1 Tax=Operophtera brumata TaxID=104452 RepID=A0A0L7LA18_OPEBR|nr:Arrowhead [Operophtera brumata]
MPPVTRKEASRQQEQEAAEHEEGDITPKGDNGSVSGVSNADEPITCGSQPTQSPAFQAPSEQFFSTLMETITRAQAEANRNLLSALFTSNFSTSSPSAPAPSTYVPASAPRTSITSGAPAPAGTACGNFSKCTVRFSGTGFSPSYLTFGRELRAPSDSATDMRAILENDNFVPGITPYLKKIAATLDEARDTHEKAQEVYKRNADKGRRPPPDYQTEHRACCACGAPIADRYLLEVGGGAWHAACLRCCVCAVQLDRHPSCFLRERQV